MIRELIEERTRGVPRRALGTLGPAPTFARPIAATSCRVVPPRR